VCCNGLFARFSTTQSAKTPSGKVSPSRLWLKREPKIKLRRLIGKVTPCRPSLKLSPKAMVSRLWGRCCTFFLEFVPSILVTPSNASIGSKIALPLAQHHAAHKSVGTRVHDRDATVPTMPCSRKVWWSISGEFRSSTRCNLILLPFFERSCCETSWCTSKPNVELLSRISHPSPFRHNTRRSIIAAGPTEPV